MHTASAFPKLKECPTVPDDVQTPRALNAGGSLIPICPLKADLPAWICMVLSTDVLR